VVLYQFVIKTAFMITADELSCTKICVSIDMNECVCLYACFIAYVCNYVCMYVLCTYQVK